MATKRRQESTSNPKEGEVIKHRYYLMQFSYVPAAWGALLKNPKQRDRVALLRPLVAAFGGCFPKIVFECEKPPVPKEKFIAFGDYDVVALLAFPDDTAAASFAMAVSQGGGVQSFKTTPLLAWDDAMIAMANAGEHLSIYQAPK